MRKELIGAASALALMTGAAFAQDTVTQGTSTMEEAPAMGSSSTMTTASVGEMLGKNVIGSDGKELGSVEDVIIDSNSGQARQLVVSSGGFLGIGAKQIAVDFKEARIQSSNGGTPIVVLQGMTQADVENLPEFQYSDTTTSLNRGFDTGTSTMKAPSSGAR